MRVIGIDPGLNNLGWSILEKNRDNSINYIASGVIKTNSKDDISIRLSHLFTSLELIIEKYDPDYAGLEETFVNKNAKSSLYLGFARGTILACIGKYKLHLKEFSPTHIKKTITGAGRAEKSQIQRMLNIILPSAKFSSDDEADAIAIAYCCSIINPKLF